MTDPTPQGNDLVYELRHGARHETAERVQDLAADEIEFLDSTLSDIYAARALYLATWVAWIEARESVPIVQWVDDYSRECLCPNPDGNELVERVTKKINARLREAVERFKMLTRERDEARAEVCMLRASSTNATPEIYAEYQAYAQSRGWHELVEDKTDE